MLVSGAGVGAALIVWSRSRPKKWRLRNTASHSRVIFCKTDITTERENGSEHLVRLLKMRALETCSDCWAPSLPEPMALASNLR